AHDRVGLPQRARTVDQRRHLAIGIQRKVFGAPVRATAEIDVLELDRRLQVLRDRTGLARVHRVEPVELHRVFSLRLADGFSGSGVAHGPPASLRRLAAVCSPIAPVRRCCALRHAGSAASSVREPLRVMAAMRERASLRSARNVTQPCCSATARLRVNVVRSVDSISAISPTERGPPICSADSNVNWVLRRPCARKAWSNSRVITRDARRTARHRQRVVSSRPGMVGMPIGVYAPNCLVKCPDGSLAVSDAGGARDASSASGRRWLRMAWHCEWIYRRLYGY